MAGDDEIPKYYATRKYKEWVQAERKRRKLTFAGLASEVRRRGGSITPQGLEQFLSKPGSNTTLMPILNKILGLPQPTHFDPTTPLSRLHHLVDANWDRVPETTQEAWRLLLAGRDSEDT
jgi:hypothetical protein